MNVVKLATPARPETWQDFEVAIRKAWQGGVESIVETGRLLNEAKARLPYGEYESMVQLKLPFTVSTARRLRAIARNPVISNRAHGHALPPVWRTLYELTKFPDETVLEWITGGRITAATERKDITAIRQPKADATETPKRGRGRPRKDDTPAKDATAQIPQLNENAQKPEPAPSSPPPPKPATTECPKEDWEVKAAARRETIRNRVDTGAYAEVVADLKSLPKDERIRTVKRIMRDAGLEIRDFVFEMKLNPRS